MASQLTARVLRVEEFSAALAVCAQDPVASVLASSRIEAAMAGPSLAGSAWGVFDGADMIATCWAGANLVPVTPGGAGIRELAILAMRERHRFSSLVGSAEPVLGMWDVLSQAWPKPREIRRQPSLTITSPPDAAGDTRVRLARTEEVDILLPASVAMFTEEYGYSPMLTGGGYAARVRNLVESGRSYVIVEPDADGVDRVLFKAEVGALALGVAQLQGVWVAPQARRHGLGAAGMTAVVHQVLASGAHTVSLYVNDYNKAARRTYRRAGFREHGEYATVVL